MKINTFILLLFNVVFLNAQEQNYNIKNISNNTSYSDFGVSYYNDTTVVFASSRKGKSIDKRVWFDNQQPYLELFTGILNDDGEISNIEKFSKNINTKFHESNVAFTKDLKTVYFSRNNYLNNKFKKDSTGMNLIQLYKAELTVNGEWENIQPMPFNNDNYITAHPALNAKEDKLYFVSNMSGTIGLTDIYVVDIYKDGTYGAPQNLGPEVNTSKREMFPFMDINDILYFSSEGFENGKGGLDIYAAKIVDNKVFGAVQNLGFPINSIQDDFSMVFKKDKRKGYFSSNRKGGIGDDDIYYFEEKNPLIFGCYNLVEGIVKDEKTNELLPNTMVKLFDQSGKIITSIQSDKLGTFSIKLACDDIYKVEGSKQSYNDTIISLTSTTKNNQKLTVELLLEKKDFVKDKNQLMVDINPIYFDLNSSLIRSDAKIELDKVVEIMYKYPEIRIECGSHTDSRASIEFNEKLSNQRAKNSVKYIVSKGISLDRISGKGYGETQLKNNCTDGVKCSELDHQLNRRTEFVILNPEVIKF